MQDAILSHADDSQSGRTECCYEEILEIGVAATGVRGKILSVSKRPWSLARGGELTLHVYWKSANPLFKTHHVDGNHECPTPGRTEEYRLVNPLRSYWTVQENQNRQW